MSEYKNKNSFTKHIKTSKPTREKKLNIFKCWTLGTMIYFIIIIKEKKPSRLGRRFAKRKPLKLDLKKQKHTSMTPYFWLCFLNYNTFATFIQQTINTTNNHISPTMTGTDVEHEHIASLNLTSPGFNTTVVLLNLFECTFLF